MKSSLTARVLVRSDGLWRAGQVEDDELGLVRLVDDDLVQPHRSVHATDVGGLVPAWIKENKCIT